MRLVRYIHRLTGGRPMRRDGFAFTDRVSGESVCYWTDRLGRRWLATGAWSWFRVSSPSAPTTNPEEGPA